MDSYVIQPNPLRLAHLALVAKIEKVAEKKALAAYNKVLHNWDATSIEALELEQENKQLKQAMSFSHEIAHANRIELVAFVCQGSRAVGMHMIS